MTDVICFSFLRHEKFFGLFVCFLMTDVIYFSFSGMRSSLVCLFVSS